MIEAAACSACESAGSVRKAAAAQWSARAEACMGEQESRGSFHGLEVRMQGAADVAQALLLVSGGAPRETEAPPPSWSVTWFTLAG